MRIEVLSTTGDEVPANVIAVWHWKNSFRTGRGLALVVVKTPASWPLLAPNWKSTFRTTHRASVLTSLNTMLLQSPAWGVVASSGVVSPPKFGLSSRRDVTTMRPVVLLLPTM